jgi:hypothetical protein
MTIKVTPCILVNHCSRSFKPTPLRSAVDFRRDVF